ncbi:MAG: FliO/MopB family protein [Bacteriovoracaceae bacterium]|nr:FliO/MopB family protein [Bacteriovoracaceae bacterium]
MKLLGLFVLFLSFGAKALDVKNVTFKENQKDGVLSIEYKGVLKETPDITIKDDMIQVVIPQSKLTKSFNRKLKFSNPDSGDLKIKADNKKDTTSIEIKLPYDIAAHHEQVEMMIRGEHIDIGFPKLAVSKKSRPEPRTETRTEAPTTEKKTDDFVKNNLNEDFLNKLANEYKPEVKVETAIEEAKNSAPEVKTVLKTDMVALKQSSAEKKQFSMLGYAGKFTAFLGMVLVLFYVVVTLFRKGVISRTKLGFLNNTSQMVIIGNTHVGPKKSLMMVKVHKQVFLLANTENGINFLSEVNDVAGLLKGGELEVAGDNFDTNLTSNDNKSEDELNVKLKADITQSSDEGLKVSMKKINFKDQLKEKVKSLKPMQQ